MTINKYIFREKKKEISQGLESGRNTSIVSDEHISDGTHQSFRYSSPSSLATMATGGSDVRGRASRHKRPGTVEILAPNRTESPSTTDTDTEPEEESSQEVYELMTEIGKSIRKDGERGKKVLESYEKSWRLNDRKNNQLKAKDQVIAEMQKQLKAKEASEKKAQEGKRQAVARANFFSTKMTEITKEAPKMPDAED